MTEGLQLCQLHAGQRLTQLMIFRMKHIHIDAKCNKVLFDHIHN